MARHSRRDRRREPGVQVEHLVAFLEGRSCEQPHENELAWAFAGTPVLAIDGHDLQRGKTPSRRSRMASNAIERAAARVTAFVEDSIAISDGRVMVRGPGLLVSRHPAQFANQRATEWSLMPWREYRPDPGRIYRPGDLVDAVAFEREATGDGRRATGDGRRATGDEKLPLSLLEHLWLAENYEAGDGDIVETANELPRVIHAMVRRRLLGRLPVQDRGDLVQADGGILAEAMRRLGPWYAKSTTGELGLDDAAAAITAYEGVVDALGSVVPYDRARLRLDELEIAFRMFRERMVPRIHTRVHFGYEADMASLSALA